MYDVQRRNPETGQWETIDAETVVEDYFQEKFGLAMWEIFEAIESYNMSFTTKVRSALPG